VGDPKRFRISIDDLERSVRVEPDELIESVDTDVDPTDDPRGPLPDRDWFASGG
jgi:hypothetical protein